MVIMGAEAQAVAVAWQVYEITHRAIDLGYTGLVLFLPGLLFLLPAGHVADRYDRRMVILVCYLLQILCTLTLLVFALQGLRRVEPIFAVLFLIGSGRAFSGPASSALLPHLVTYGTLRERHHLGSDGLPDCQHRRAGRGRATLHLTSQRQALRGSHGVSVYPGHRDQDLWR